MFLELQPCLQTGKGKVPKLLNQCALEKLNQLKASEFESLAAFSARNKGIRQGSGGGGDVGEVSVLKV